MRPVPLWAGAHLRGCLLICASGLALAACGSAGGSVPPISQMPAPVAPAPTPSPAPPQNFDTAEYRRSTAAATSTAITAWQANATGRGVTLGFVDSGIDSGSAEFAGRISGQSRDVSGQGRTVQDESGHGTAVAAVAVAARNDSQIMGVAFEATIASFRADNGQCADGCGYADSSIASGVDAAASAGARAINISLGGSAANSVLRNALIRASAQGAVIVLSAGNEGAANPDPLPLGALNTVGPAGVIIVGSVNAGGAISGFSNRAGSAAGNYLVAVGEEVRSFDHQGQAWLYSGTSFAAPAVTGAVALLAQAFPNLTAARITEILLTSADDLGDPGPDPIYGRGRLNIGRAMSPIGQTSLAGTAVPVSATAGGALGSALGTGLSAGAALKSVPVVDSFGRPFRFALGGALKPVSAARLAGRIAAARLETSATDLSTGPFRAALTLRATGIRNLPATDSFRSGDWQVAHLGFAQRGVDGRAASRNPLRETRLTLRRGSGTGSGSGDWGLSLASGRLAREALPGSSAGGFAAEDGLTPDDNMGVGGRQLVMADWRGGGLTLALAATHRRLALPRLEGLSADNRQDQLLAAASWARGPLALTLHAADTQESGAFLGTRLSAGYGLSGGRTQTIGAAADFGHGAFGLRLAGTRGRATAHMSANSLLRADGALAIESWSAQVRAPLAGGRLGLFLAQPLAVTGGGFRLANDAPVPAGVTARETSREIGWSRDGLGVAAFSRRNAGNQPGLSDGGVALTWKADF
jgi:hypothetical protein